MKDNVRINILGWTVILASALGLYDYSLLKTARAENENLKQELATVKQDSMADILKLLKDRNDIIISVKHCTMELKAKRLKQQLIGE